MSNLDKQIDYWKISVDQNWKASLDLFKTKHYDTCLFFCHLTLEKLLKGLIVKQTRKPAPYIHDLENLALTAKLQLSKEQLSSLRTITGFNLSGRYDDFKFAFYKQCTRTYTEKYFNISKELSLWLKKEYLKK